jgi:hypothetical protein
MFDPDQKAMLRLADADGSDGSLTGYVGGIARKWRLLRHEGAPVSQTLFP